MKEKTAENAKKKKKELTEKFKHPRRLELTGILKV